MNFKKSSLKLLAGVTLATSVIGTFEIIQPEQVTVEAMSRGSFRSRPSRPSGGYRIRRSGGSGSGSDFRYRKSNNNGRPKPKRSPISPNKGKTRKPKLVDKKDVNKLPSQKVKKALKKVRANVRKVKRVAKRVAIPSSYNRQSIYRNQRITMTRRELDNLFRHDRYFGYHNQSVFSNPFFWMWFVDRHDEPVENLPEQYKQGYADGVEAYFKDKEENTTKRQQAPKGKDNDYLDGYFQGYEDGPEIEKESN